MDRFLLNYRLTPHSTTGVSLAELMFGRRLRSRLDLLWPADSVSSRVARKQQAQMKEHTNAPRSINLPPESPVMIRNYTPGGSKWTPSTVVKQTGPLSYRCATPSGKIVKRHQDQIIKRSIPQPQSPASNPPVAISISSPAKTSFSEEPSSTPSSPSIQEGVEPASNSSPSPGLRRSSRVKRPVVRLDL